jgi:hypothetical protein
LIIILSFYPDFPKKCFFLLSKPLKANKFSLFKKISSFVTWETEENLRICYYIIRGREETKEATEMKIHIRCNGESRTFSGKEVGISRETSDEAIREIISGVVEIPKSTLRNLMIDRNPDGIVVRPPAVFG